MFDYSNFQNFKCSNSSLGAYMNESRSHLNERDFEDMKANIYTNEVNISF